MDFRSGCMYTYWLLAAIRLFTFHPFNPSAEQRAKEIGIRKVMGASVLTLWKMLSMDFVLLVFISCFIAVKRLENLLALSKCDKVYDWLNLLILFS